MPVSIHPLGYIRGGNCDRRHHERARRERASTDCVDFLLERKVIKKTSRGTYRVGRIPRLGWRVIESLAGAGVPAKCAWYRIFQDILPVLQEKKRQFTLKQFRMWANDIQKFEFQLGGSLDPIRIVGGLSAPHCPQLYDKRKKAGDFKSERAAGVALKPLPTEKENDPSSPTESA